MCGSDFNPLELPLRCNGLTELAIVQIWGFHGPPSLTSESSRQVLSWCPQLRTCRLCIHAGPPNDTRPEAPTLELSFLHTLNVECSGTLSTTVQQMFARLFLPQLRHFKLRGTANHEETIPYAPGPLVAAAPCIESLNMNVELFSKSALVDFIHGLPPTVLEIRYTKMHQAKIFEDLVMLESLISSPDSPTPCSGLQVLELNQFCPFSDDVVLRFLKSRTLKRVVL
ncbi:hypothetical protein DFH09DRAFT_1077607 [Mycena vulgaris]|nr:hypothetical protein DFH09DRAFT_1077607 [Mycena vulgaris]